MVHAVGRSIPRVDGADKVTGAALYVDDLHVPGCLHAATVRSETTNASIRSSAGSLERGSAAPPDPGIRRQMNNTTRDVTSPGHPAAGSDKF